MASDGMLAAQVNGRIVLVTGGASGIGLATCQRFASAGDTVVVADIDGVTATARAAELGSPATGLACDVSAPADCQAAVAACMARYGRLDVLVNNAGVIDAGPTSAIDTSLANFRRLLAVNLTGSHRLARESAAAMRGQGGAIVNIASAGGFVASPHRSGYGASKAGVMAMTRALAAEWAPLGIRVNAVAPGYIRTNMVEGLITSGKVDASALEARIPLGRLGRPAEIAEVIFFAASSGAADMTGTTLTADGGFLAVGGAGAPSSGAAPPLSYNPGPRSVVVTGAASVFGRRVAEAFVFAGDRVMLFDDDASGLEAIRRAVGPQSMACVGAATDEIALERMANEAVGAWGRIDVLVHVAGSVGAGAFAASPVGEDVLEDELVAAFAANKVVGRKILAAGGGAVVNITSAEAFRGLEGGDASAAASAGGLVMLSRSLACEWAGRGVRVNALAAGALARPEQLASAAVFLASSAASYVTGSVFTVDRGWTAFDDASRR